MLTTAFPCLNWKWEHMKRVGGWYLECEWGENGCTMWRVDQKRAEESQSINHLVLSQFKVTDGATRKMGMWCFQVLSFEVNKPGEWLICMRNVGKCLVTWRLNIVCSWISWISSCYYKRWVPLPSSNLMFFKYHNSIL